MSNSNVSVKPTPIQRNKPDAAVELTQLYTTRFALDSETDIETVFTKYYALASYLEINYRSLDGLVSEEIKSALKKNNL